MDWRREESKLTIPDLRWRSSVRNFDTFNYGSTLLPNYCGDNAKVVPVYKTLNDSSFTLDLSVAVCDL